MSAGKTPDFTSLLDDLLDRIVKSDEKPARPAIPFDYLSVVDDLHSGRIKVSQEAVEAEYDTVENLHGELQALLDHAAARAEQQSEPLPSIEPELIALELGLDEAAPASLGHVRRAFALNNHPDRVAPHLRERALTRMQVANRLIDEAKRRALARTAR